MRLDLSDEETSLLTTLLARVIDADHYQLSPRVRMLKAILAKLRGEPPRAPSPPPPPQYEPPSRGRYRRRRYRAADGPLGSQGFRAWLRYTAVSSRLNRTRINFRTLVCPSAPLSTTVSHCASSGPSGRTIRPLGLI